MTPRRSLLLPAIAGTTGLALAGWTLVGSRPAAASPPSTSSTLPSVSAAEGSPGINLRRTVTVRVVEKTKDAVVNISTTKLVAQRVIVGGPYWQQETGVALVPRNSLGSGFIIHPDGYVVTNNHVVDKARQITVELADGRKLPADLISADPDADLAVLRIHSPAPLPTLELGESSDLMIGEPVIAVGNPLGFSHSVSTGIVSALHRDIDPKSNPGQTKGEEAALRDLVQTDAAINPGNSGGPLLNAYGQVIGINTAIRSDAQNIGFAIPIDRLRDLIPELMNPSQAIKVDVAEKLAERRSMTEPATVNVSVVDAAKPARVLTAINGHRVTDLTDAYAALLKVRANQPVDFTWADGKTDRVTATATPIPDAVVQAKKTLGVSLLQNTPMIAERNHFVADAGLVVVQVDADGVAAKADVRPGDVIIQVDKFPTATLDDLGALLPRFPQTGAVTIFVQRGRYALRRTLQFGGK